MLTQVPFLTPLCPSPSRVSLEEAYIATDSNLGNCCIQIHKSVRARVRRGDSSCRFGVPSHFQ